MDNWHQIATLDEIPPLGARVIKNATADIAVFRTAKDDVYALRDVCPHKGGPLSQGMVAGNEVTCPLHGMHICLSDGKAVAPDEGCVTTHPVKVEDGIVYLQM
ncbi:MAG: nitrite reductase small subunit NirD [Gallionellaceae bacterium]|nr:nitrite reductase small subunit NirD [Gallionellaceae bacterium]